MYGIGVRFWTPRLDKRLTWVSVPCWGSQLVVLHPCKTREASLTYRKLLATEKLMSSRLEHWWNVSQVPEVDLDYLIAWHDENGSVCRRTYWGVSSGRPAAPTTRTPTKPTSGIFRTVLELTLFRTDTLQNRQWELSTNLYVRRATLWGGLRDRPPATHCSSLTLIRRSWSLRRSWSAPEFLTTYGDRNRSSPRRLRGRWNVG